MLPEWNPILACGLRVVFRDMSIPEAVEWIQSSGELTSLSDSEFSQVITEAQDSVVSRREIAVLHPGTLAIDAYLMVAAVDQRCAEIAGLPRSAKRDRRLARWHGVAADCINLKGWIQLLLSPRDALDSFMRGELRARAMPDYGHLRTRQVLAARFGRRVCGRLLGNSQLVADSEAEMKDLILGYPGTERHMNRLLKQEETATGILKEREKRQAAGDRVRPLESPGLDLFVAVEALATAIEAGMPIDEARSRLASTVRLDLVRPLCLYELAFLHRRHAQSPAEVESRSRLLYAAAKTVKGAQAELATAYSALALGSALVERSRVPHREFAETHVAYRPDPDTYGEALPLLEQAWETLSAGPHARTQRGAASAAQQLLIANNGLGRLEPAAHFGSQAIKILKQLLQAAPDAALTVELGIATGNLAQVWDRTGRREEALNAFYGAFELFSGARDIARAKQTLHLIFNQSVLLGRYDQAVAACERLAPVLQESGDVLAAARNYLDLARMSARTSPGRRGEMLERAESLLDPVLRDPAQRFDALRSRFDLLGQRANALIAEYRTEASEEKATQARNAIDEASSVAGELKHPEYLGMVYRYYAMLFEKMGQLNEAERYCRMLEELPVSEGLRQRAADVLGGIQLNKGEYDSAAVSFRRSLSAYKDDPLALSLAQYRLGKALLSAGEPREAAEALESAAGTFERARAVLYEGSRISIRGAAEDTYQHLIYIYGAPASPLFDALRSWRWLEEAKGRTLAEALADAPFPLANVPAEAAGLYSQEQELQQSLRNLRLQITLSPPGDPSRLALIAESDSVRRGLLAIWDRLSVHLPDYVALRTGRPATWEDLLELFDEHYDQVVGAVL